jgi:hypothetical protein
MEKDGVDIGPLKSLHILIAKDDELLVLHI